MVVELAVGDASAALGDRAAIAGSSRPSSTFDVCGGPLDCPSQRATETGIGSPETGKFPIALVVSPPQKPAFDRQVRHGDER